MSFRRKIYDRAKDRRIFSRTAGMVDKRNLRIGPMRGGYRL